LEAFFKYCIRIFAVVLIISTIVASLIDIGYRLTNQGEQAKKTALSTSGISFLKAAILMYIIKRDRTCQEDVMSELAVATI
jgi:hypothetical protein